MSETASNSLNPFLVVVLRGLTEEEPTIVPQSWLCDGNSMVMWPPGFASKNTICKKVTPGANWIKYKVVQVYWRTATDNYQKATEYLEIAEDTSSEESIEQKVAELADPRKRKYRHQKDLNNDNDSIQVSESIKKMKSESVKQGSVSQTTNSANPLELFKLPGLPEILIDQNSEIPDKTTRSTEPEPEILSDQNSKYPDETTRSTEPEPEILSDQNSKYPDETTRSTEPKPEILSDQDSEKPDKSTRSTESEQEILSDQDSEKPDKSTRSTESEPETLIGEDKCDGSADTDVESNMPFTENDNGIPESTTSIGISDSLGNEDDETDLESADNNTSKGFLKKLSFIKKNDPLDSLKASSDQNIHKETSFKGNEAPECSKASEQAQNDTMNYTRSGSSKVNGYSAIRIHGENNFKPEDYLELSVNEKLNVLGLQQQQIIANQAKLAVAMEVKQSETPTQESGLSLDETVAIKGFLPIEDHGTFEFFDENLRDDRAFRTKVWQFLVPYMSSKNWKQTVRRMLGEVMGNGVQSLYSCRGQKGKIAFNCTFLYELIEAATTTRPEKRYRAEEREVRSYVSEYLKHAKSRTLGASTNEENGESTRKKGSKCNSTRGKSIMSEAEKRRMALSLSDHVSVDSGDTDDSN